MLLQDFNIVSDSLSVFSTLARVKQQNYALLESLNIVEYASRYLWHCAISFLIPLRLLNVSHASLRAKACNLFGNLFKHSAQFYRSSFRSVDDDFYFMV
jgi:hypothetical protein